MLVKAILKNDKYDYFRDKTTAKNIEDQVKRHYGELFECADDLAKERIEKGFVKKATRKEIKEFEKIMKINTLT